MCGGDSARKRERERERGRLIYGTLQRDDFRSIVARKTEQLSVGFRCRSWEWKVWQVESE